MFERGRLFELRRGYVWTASLATPELVTFESEIEDPQIMQRLRRAKWNHARRAMKRVRSKAS